MKYTIQYIQYNIKYKLYLNLSENFDMPTLICKMPLPPLKQKAYPESKPFCCYGNRDALTCPNWLPHRCVKQLERGAESY